MNRDVFVRNAQNPRSRWLGAEASKDIGKKVEKDYLTKEKEMLRGFHMKRAEEKLKKEAKKQMKTPESRASMKEGKRVSESMRKDFEKQVQKDKLFEENRFETARKMKDDAMKAFVRDRNEEAVRLLATSYAMMGGRKFNEGEVLRQLPRATEKINELIEDRRVQRTRGMFSSDIENARTGIRTMGIGGGILDIFS